MRLRAWVGEALRWYVTRARHPFHGYITGHYWPHLCRHRWWLRYDRGVISVSLQDYLQRHIFVERYYERPLLEWLRSNLSSHDVFWDVGANIGAVTLVAARHCRKVVAFEPDPRSRSLLLRHLEANNLDNVAVLGLALSDRQGRGALVQAPDTNWGMTRVDRGRGEGRGLSVPLETGDDVVNVLGEPFPTVMKVDVEGEEHAVFAGATHVLGSPSLRAIIFEADGDLEAGPSSREIVSLLTSAGFVIESFGRSSPDCIDTKCNYLAVRTATCHALSSAS